MATGFSETPKTKFTIILADNSTVLLAYARFSIFIIDCSIEFTASEIFFAYFSAIKNPPSISCGYFI
jgi:hypothetical protein